MIVYYYQKFKFACELAKQYFFTYLLIVREKKYCACHINFKKTKTHITGREKLKNNLILKQKF